MVFRRFFDRCNSTCNYVQRPWNAYTSIWWWKLFRWKKWYKSKNIVFQRFDLNMWEMYLNRKMVQSIHGFAFSSALPINLHKIYRIIVAGVDLGCIILNPSSMSNCLVIFSYLTFCMKYSFFWFGARSIAIFTSHCAIHF